MFLPSSHHRSTVRNSRKGNAATFSLAIYVDVSAIWKSVTLSGITRLFCRLYRAYQKLYASMHDKVIGPHKTQFRRDENYGKKVFV